MNSSPFRVLPAGDSALLVEITDTTELPDLPAIADAVRTSLSSAGPIDVVAAYDSFLIRYDPMLVSPEEVSAVLDSIGWTDARRPVRCFSVPVLYGGDAGPDLMDVATLHGMDAEEVVRRHAAIDYRIRCIGFSPGFPYLEGLDPALHTDRLPTPRVRVPAGSVAIGGRQTGVYPISSPGGWRLIGRTPLVLFDPRHDPPVAYNAGDLLRFTPIDPDEFEHLRHDRRPPEQIP